MSSYSRCPVGLACLLVGVLSAGSALAETSTKDFHAESELPQGFGLAGKFILDKGLESHPDVIFREDFEGPDFRDWKEVKKSVLVTEAENVNSGRQAVQMTATLGKDTGGNLVHWFMEKGQDTCHARFYVKFASDMKYLHHFVQLNAGAKQWSSFGGAGKRSRGDDNFKVVIDPTGHWGRIRPPGAWHFYCYWQEMKPDGRGDYWGNGFWPEPKVIPDLGKWLCMEVMVKANDAGKHNGELGLWQDGKLIGHFKGFNWRSTDKLKVNVFWLSFYVTEQTFRHNKVKEPVKVSRCWFDDAVVAKSYIGPIRREPEKKEASPAPAPASEDARRPGSGPGNAERTRAAKLYRDARTAERAGMKGIAERLYARLVKEHPRSPLASKAAERLGADAGGPQ